MRLLESYVRNVVVPERTVLAMVMDLAILCEVFVSVTQDGLVTTALSQFVQEILLVQDLVMASALLVENVYAQKTGSAINVKSPV